MIDLKDKLYVHVESFILSACDIGTVAICKHEQHLYFITSFLAVCLALNFQRKILVSPICNACSHLIGVPASQEL